MVLRIISSKVFFLKLGVICLQIFPLQSTLVSFTLLTENRSVDQGGVGCRGAFGIFEELFYILIMMVMHTGQIWNVFYCRSIMLQRTTLNT